MTVIFHGRRDLGTDPDLRRRRAVTAPGDAVAGDTLLRVPCDLDLAEADDRDAAERLYAEQVGAMRDALVGADTVLDIWREPLDELTGGGLAVDRSIALSVRLPAHRLLPTALVAPERRLVVTAVCEARTLAAGRPPLGHRLRPAGRRARLPAARRPRALPATTSCAPPPGHARDAGRSGSSSRRPRSSASWSSTPARSRRRRDAARLRRRRPERGRRARGARWRWRPRAA